MFLITKENVLRYCDYSPQFGQMLDSFLSRSQEDPKSFEQDTATVWGVPH